MIVSNENLVEVIQLLVELLVKLPVNVTQTTTRLEGKTPIGVDIMMPLRP